MSRKFVEKHNSIADNILKLAKEHPCVIQDYRKLVQFYWYYFDDLKVFIPLEVLEKITQPESIGRSFRKLKADGFIIEDEKTHKWRLRSEDEYRSYYRRNTK